MVPKSQQHDEITSNLFFGGMLREEIGGFHPGKFFADLLRKTEEAGAIICAKIVVKDITEISKGKKSLINSKRNLSAGKVIVATNAYTGTKYPFSKFLRRRLIPVQSCIIVTETLAKAISDNGSRPACIGAV